MSGQDERTISRVRVRDIGSQVKLRSQQRKDQTVHGPSTKLTGSSKITAVGHLETRGPHIEFKISSANWMVKPPKIASTANPHGVPDGSVLDGLVHNCDERDKQADACHRPPMSRQQLPRQTAAGSGAATPGSSGPFPFTHWGLWCLLLGAEPALVHLSSWQSGRFLFGMPARGPSRPLPRLASSWVAAMLFLLRGLSSSVGLPATRLNLVGLRPGQRHLQCARDQSS